MSDEEPGDIGMQQRKCDCAVEGRRIGEKPFGHAARLDRRQGCQHGPVSTRLQPPQHLVARLTGCSNGFGIKPRVLVDVLAGDDEAERDDRAA